MVRRSKWALRHVAGGDVSHYDSYPRRPCPTLERGQTGTLARWSYARHSAPRSGARPRRAGRLGSRAQLGKVAAPTGPGTGAEDRTDAGSGTRRVSPSAVSRASASTTAGNDPVP